MCGRAPEAIKNVMGPEMYADTSVFERFLKARNFDIKAAENMLRNHVKWRKMMKIDSILLWYTPHEVSTKYIPLSHIGFDKDGSPISYLSFGDFDIRGCLKSVKWSEILNFWTSYLEAIMKNSNSLTDNISRKNDTWNCIVNFENFSLRMATDKQTLRVGLGFASVYEANYPEKLKCGIIINTSIYFQMIFAIVKNFISENTLNKIKIFGKEGWREELLTKIDADVLPAFLGGNRTDTDGDPMCRTFVNHGGLIPEKYYAVHNKSDILSKPGVEKLVIKRASTKKVELLVSKPNSHIEWEFEVKKADINFRLLYEDSNLGTIEIFNKERVETSISSEEGVFNCTKAGTYYLEYDNSYSWIHSKEVFYIVDVINANMDDKIPSFDT